MTASAAQSGETTVSDQNTQTTISNDECFDLLSNHRRRYTLHYLQQNESAVELGGLAEQIAAWENETDVDEISYDERKRVYTSLQQVHLPRMDDAGVVKFDDREGTIKIGPAAKDLDIYLEVVQGREIPWSIFYFGLGVLNTLIIGAFALGLWPLVVLPQIGLPVFVVTSFLMTSVAHLYIAQTEMQLGESDVPPSMTEQ